MNAMLKNEGSETVKLEVKQRVEAKESQSMPTEPMQKKPHLYSNKEEALMQKLKCNIQDLPLDELHALKAILNEEIPAGLATIFMDFSTSLDLRVGETNNSSQDAHAVLAIFVICHLQ